MHTTHRRPGSGRRLAVATAAVICIISAALSTAPTGARAGDALAAPVLVRTPDLAVKPPAGARPVGATPAATPMSVEVVLQPSHPDRLSSLLAAQYRAGSAQYHRWLTPGQFTARFGPSPATVQSTIAWLQSKGLRASRQSTFTISAAGPAGRIGAAFATPLERFRTLDDAEGDLATGAPILPGSLRPQIGAILGLDTLPLAAVSSTTRARAANSRSQAGGVAQAAVGQPASCQAARTAAGSGYYTLDQLGAAYGLPSLFQEGLTGQGQTIGLFELGAHDPGAVSTYTKCFGLTSSISTIQVDGGAPSGPGTTEADADIEQAATQAPGASIISYEGAADTPSHFVDLWRRIITDDTARVVSTSWGICEPAAQANGIIQPLTALFQQAASQGQSILAASGDSGSEGCLLAGADAPLTVYPASDPMVTAVAGTSLRGPGNEVVWNDCRQATDNSCANALGSVGAGGGAMSGYSARPSYQPDMAEWQGTLPPCGSKCREVPDISANAGVGMVVYTGGSWAAVIGTSLSSPFLAGMVADRNQGCTTPTGLFNPVLYSLIGSAVQQTYYGTALHDVVTGDNDLTRDTGVFAAATGYDLASGVGSPLAAGLGCPEVTGIDRTSVAPGDTVTISGTGLEGAAFSFGRLAGQVTTATATQATVVVPAGAGGPTVVSASGPLGAGTLTVQISVSGSPTATTTSTTSPASTTSTTAPRLSASCPNTRGMALGSAVGIAADPTGSCPGYWVVNAAGAVSAFGAAGSHGDLAGVRLAAPIVGMTATPDGGGYWLVASDGGVFNFGDAGFFGSPGGTRLAAPVVGMAPTPDGRGYWEVAADGGVFSYGDARFHGSTGGLPLASPVDGIAPAPGGDGYWLVAADGGVFAFTPDGFHGSLGGIRLARPIAGMSGTPDGQGYTLVGSDGGVFSFGDAPFDGSLGSAPPASPVVSISPAPGNTGYYLVTAAGGVYTFGPGTADYGGV